MRYALVGHGRMGREIERVATARGHACVAILDPSEGVPAGMRGARVAAAQGAQVAFEFTTPASAARNVAALLRAGIPVVCGTTGWNAASAAIGDALRAGRSALIAEANFSVGVQLFYRAVAHAARSYGASGLYDPWIVEAHHRRKADAPSGTARRLAEIVEAEDARSRPVQVSSVRAGHEPGVHTVGFDAEHDVVTLTHRARGRGGFALGAVLAAEWLRGRTGRHSFAQVLDEMPAAKRRRKGERA